MNSETEISAEEFVRVWESSDSLDEVVKRLSKKSGRAYSKSLASSRASEYRNSGVKLKSMTSGRTRLDPKKLNSIVETMRSRKE